MLDRERHDTILRLVKQNTFITVHDIEALTGVSEATVRRDLAKLEEIGLINRVRGGAEVTDSLKEQRYISHELPFSYRKGLMHEKKRLIAKQAASMCSDGETIFIDGGSTTFQMVEFLTPLKLKIITNSFAIAEYLVKNSNNSIYLPGGIVDPESQLILDPINEEMYKNFYATRTFMGVAGIGPEGVTNRAINLIRTERLMIEHAEKLIILADSSKFQTSGDLLLCGFDQIDTIITDSAVAEKEKELMLNHDIKLVIV